MRPHLAFAILIATPFPAAAISSVNLSFGLESLVLCVPPTSDIVKAIAKSRIFSKDPRNDNFYVPNKPVKAFDFDVRFVGLSGVMLQPGPNLTVTSSLQDLKEKAEVATIGHKFECNDKGCWLKLSGEQAVLIYPYEADNRLTTIQCGYFGE